MSQVAGVAALVVERMLQREGSAPVVCEVGSAGHASGDVSASGGDVRMFITFDRVPGMCPVEVPLDHWLPYFASSSNVTPPVQQKTVRGYISLQGTGRRDRIVASWSKT